MLKTIKQIRDNPTAWAREAFPICKWLPKYRLGDLPYDMIAGFTVGLTLLPVSLAYAQMAYLKPEYGLYSSFLGTFIYIFLGTSKDAIIGPSAIGSMLLAQFNVMNPLYLQGDNTYATILALISGIIFLFIGFFKLGFIVNLFSIPVVSGFTSAAAFSIIASQLKTFVGIRKGPNDSPGVFVKQIKNIYDRRDEIRMLDVTFGLVSLGFLIAMEYGYEYFVKYCVSRLREPATQRAKQARDIFLTSLRLFVAARSIFVFVPATGIAYYLHSQDPKGTEERMTLVGYIKPGFPVPRAPRFEIVNTTQVWVADNVTGNGSWVEQTVVLETTQQIFEKLSVGIIIIPLMGIMELFAILKAMARKNGYRIDATQELIAVGLSNFLQSFIMSYPITAATAKTALNDRCRVKSLLSTTLSVIIILVSLVELTPVFYFVPKAALSAILIAAAHHLFDYNAARNIWKEYKPDLFLFVLTFLLCLFYDLAYGIVIAILINMVTFLRPVVSMQVSISREPLEVIQTGLPVGDHHLGRVTIIQLSHGMKYPSVDKFIDRMAHLLSTNDVHFVMDCRFVTGIDFTGLQAWRMMLRMVYQNKKHMIFTNLADHVRTQLEKIGLEHFKYVGNVETAIRQYSSKLANYGAIANNSTATGEPDAIALRRMRQTFSVIFSGESGTTAHRASKGHSAPASRQSSKLGGLEQRMNTVTTVRETTSDATPIVPSSTNVQPLEETHTQQEARLMKLLMEQTTPNLYGDIPITIGNAGDEGGLDASDDEDWHVLKEPEDIGDHLQFPTYPMQFNVQTSVGGLPSTAGIIEEEEEDGAMFDENVNAGGEVSIQLRRRHGGAKPVAQSIAIQTDGSL